MMDFSATNNIDSYSFTAYWRIENFDSKINNNFSIESPSFEIKSLKSKWYIEIAEDEGYLGVFLFKATDPKFCLTKFCVSLLTSTDWVPVLEKHNYRYKTDGHCGYGVFKVVSLEKLKKEPWVHLPNGSLTISFRVSNKLEIENSQCLIVSRMFDEKELLNRPLESFSDLRPSDLLFYPPTYKFISDKEASNAMDRKANEVKSEQTQTEEIIKLKDGDKLLKLLKEKEFSFVTLRTPSKEFFVHKAILCAKSPVFNAMFENQMVENDYNIVDIDDIDSHIMASFVRFLHFQPLDDLNWEAAVTLYYVADKYQIASLKKDCVVYLKKGLSVDNVCDAFLFAELHQDIDLMSCAQEYFSKNLKLVFTSKCWKDFLCHTELVGEILHKLGETM